MNKDRKRQLAWRKMDAGQPGPRGIVHTLETLADDVERFRYNKSVDNALFKVWIRELEARVEKLEKAKWQEEA